MKITVVTYCLRLLFLLCAGNMMGQSLEKLKSNQPSFEHLYAMATHDSTSTIKKQKLLRRAFEQNKATQNDSIRFWNFSKLAVLSTSLSDTLLFKTIGIESLKLAQLEGNYIFLGDVYWNYGSFYRINKRYDSAYYYYHQAHKSFAEAPHPYYEAKMLYNLAYINAHIKDFTKAERQLFQAIKIFRAEGRFKQLYLSFNLLGAISDDLGEYSQALGYYSEALKTLKKFTDKDYFHQELYNNIGVVYQKLGNHKKALACFKKGLVLSNIFKENPLLYAKLVDNNAYSAYLSFTGNDVEDDFVTALKIRDSLGDDAGSVISRIHLAHFFSETGDTLMGIAYAKEAFDIAVESKLNRDVLKTLELLADLDQDNSNQYLRQHISLDKKLYKRERKVRDKFMRIRFETDNYITENERLFRERIWIVCVATAIGLVLLLLYLNSRQRAKNKALRFEREQQQHNEDLFLLTLENKNTLEKGRNLERLRISEELHDGILARLFSVRFKWPFINLSGTSENLIQHKKSIDQLTAIETEIRNISHDLRNELIWNEMTFIDEVENTIKEKSELGGLKYSFTCENIGDWEALGYLKKINCSRILDEILQNIIKHASATKVDILLKAEGSSMIIRVEDNGKGFRTYVSKRGIGLKNLKARAKKINGNISITSQLGYGTLVVLQFYKKS
ncbi:tetratricopeptide repeat-containing sensor histidine kinase [Aequorivita viscosa]|nr:tetratricopeptide repeat protein [Aequorivita viscosa]